MALVSGKAKRYSIPNEPDAWMELRQLSWVELEKASDANQTKALARVKTLGPEVLEALSGGSAAKNANSDPAAAYDRATLLELGVAAWSYDEPVSAETLSRLDGETSAWAARTIVAPYARTEDAEKNGSSPSTST